MGALNISKSRPVWELSALAGLQAGVLGGMAMLVFLFAHSVLRGQPWWSYANLLGSVVYGTSALWRGFGRATFAGASFQILLSGLAGALFGVCFARTRGRMPSLLLGLSSGVIWFGISHWILFKGIAPLVPVYASQPATLLGYLILGLVLSRTSMMFIDSAPRWLLAEDARTPAAVSGTPDACEERGTGEIVPPHQLE